MAADLQTVHGLPQMIGVVNHPAGQPQDLPFKSLERLQMLRIWTKCGGDLTRGRIGHETPAIVRSGSFISVCGVQFRKDRWEAGRRRGHREGLAAGQDAGAATRRQAAVAAAVGR